jgi:peptide/nickel transport system substrate-binding protein
MESSMRRLLPAFLASICLSLLSTPSGAEPSYAIAMHGDPALPKDFHHFTYANPDAPKGGRIDYAWQGTFDSVNPFIVQGDASRGLFDMVFGNNVYDTLMARSRDEAFTLYPLLAETIDTDADRTYVEFTLDPRAKFSDGKPVTPEDVIFSFEVLRDKGRPLYKGWIDVVARMEKVGERGVRLTFNDKAGRESPLLLALLPILPRHATDAATFDKSTLKPMIASGPYVVDSVKPGEVVVLKRNPDYWAKDIPSKRGFDNYDEIRINYYRDDNTMFEAFKKGATSVQIETDTSRWASGYNFPAVTDGRVTKESFKSGLPSGMFGFVLNTRGPAFSNRDVRMALAGLFDFEWANKNLFSGSYKRIRSYYDGSELSSFGNPASDAEKALLGAAADAILPEIMAGTWAPPVSDGSGRDRAFLKKGFDALAKAGYKLEGETMIGPDGKPLTFEIMLNGKSGEPVAATWQRTLERLGIKVSIRSVDSAQYLQRQRVYDFDAMLMTYTGSLSPGTEQAYRWGSASAKADGTYNFAGVADPAIDAMIDRLLKVRSREEFVTAVRAYDRLLLNGAYVVPLYYQPDQWVAYWADLKHPGTTPIYGFQLPTWWRETE